MLALLKIFLVITSVGFAQQNVVIVILTVLLQVFLASELKQFMQNMLKKPLRTAHSTWGLNKIVFLQNDCHIFM